MLLVAGINLRNLKPCVWDPSSPHYLADLRAIMLSYADFHRAPSLRRAAMEQTLRHWLGAPDHIRIYVDNGAFSFLRSGNAPDVQAYTEFVQAAQPDWHPIPIEWIPAPSMDDADQFRCMQRTMAINRAFTHTPCTPVIHLCRRTEWYVSAMKQHPVLANPPRMAVGGLAANTMRTAHAASLADLVSDLVMIRRAFPHTDIHAFGVGGMPTLHLAALLRFASVDSSGWRNRAAYGLVQIAGRGERRVVLMSSWEGREPDTAEWDELAACPCPACRHAGIAGLTSKGADGFCHRATHNLWTILHEVRMIDEHMRNGTYRQWRKTHLRHAWAHMLLDAAQVAIDAPPETLLRQSRLPLWE